MKVLICPDSFKNCLPASGVAESIARGIHAVWPDAEICKIPLADGGEGTVSAVVSASGGNLISCTVHDPLMRPIQAEYGILGDGETAVIEMSAASGVELLSKEELNPLVTTTYGTGELIKSALDLGCRRIVLGLGGSATNDCGAGMFQALGGSIVDSAGCEIGKGGGALVSVSRIDLYDFNARVGDVEFVIACDVQNPLLGNLGATSVFAPQKGASEQDIRLLENGLTIFHDVLSQSYGHSFADIPGAGAAGGLGAGAMAFLGGTVSPGFSIIADILDLQDHIAWADFVVTGEGKTDSQTMQGKVPWGVLNLANRLGKPVISVAGTIDSSAHVLTEKHGLSALVPIVSEPLSLEEAINHAPVLLFETGKRIAQLISVGLACRL